MKNKKNKLIIICLCLIIVSPVLVFCITPPTWRSHLNFEAVDVPLDTEIQEFIYYMTYTYDLDFYLVMGLIKTESSYKSNTISKSNDYGLMQINKINFNWLSDNLGIDDFLDPYQNIRAGIFMLCDLYKKYETTERVLMAYNLGESGAGVLWRGGVFSTKYVDKVLENAAAVKTLSTTQANNP